MNKLLLSTVLLFFWSIQSQAQKTTEKVPLSHALREIEHQFNISFSYADQNIAGIEISPPNKDWDLEKTIKYLSEKTGLVFLKLNNQQIAITVGTETPLLSLCGVIVDGNTPLAGASIVYTSKGSVTDEKGYFSIRNLSEKDILTISFLGYADMIIKVADISHTECDTIRMQQQSVRLQEVLINNYLTKGIDISADGAIQIDANSLGILPGITDPDVLLTVQALPGISSVNETVSDINIRGGTNDQNLILWDGIKMYQSGHFFGLISSFNPYLADKVMLIKNGTTTAMGDGVSGVIDIRTDDEVNDTFDGGAGINMINADLFLKIPLARRVSLHLSGRRSISDLVQTPTYSEYFNRVFTNTEVSGTGNPVADTVTESGQEFNFYDFSAKLLYDINQRDKIRLSFMNLENVVDYSENAIIGADTTSKTSSLSQSSTVGSLSYSRAWSNNVVTTASGYISSYLLSGTNQNLLKDQRLLQENEVLETGIKIDTRARLSPTTDLFSGYQFIETGITNLEDINNPTYRRRIKKVLRSHAIFSEANFTSPSGNTNLRAGLRLNYYEKFNKVFLEPRLAFNQRIHNNVSFEILGEMKSQATVQVVDLQKDFLGVENRRWVLADDENVPVVRSRQVSAGLRFQKDKILISADGYIKEVNDISSFSQGFQNQFQYQRAIGSYSVTGLDALFNLHLSQLDAWINYSLARNDYNFPTFTPSSFPNNLDIRHSVSLGFNYQVSRFKFAAGLNWRTGKPYTTTSGIENDEIVYETPNALYLPNYLRLDLSAKYPFKISKGVNGEIGASIWNILDHENIINQYYRIDDAGQLETVQQYALGFTPNVMMRISF